MFTILIHIYYSDSWEKIFREPMLALRKYQPLLLINICDNDNNLMSTVKAITADFSNAIIITTPNKGKDIGGKLALIDVLLRMGTVSEYVVMLHDKKSLYSATGEAWRSKLFNIIQPEVVPVVLKHFSNTKVGIVATKAFIKNEFDNNTKIFETTNNTKIYELLDRYNLKTNDYSFVGGTMFWIRTAIVKDFFNFFSPLSCREILEEGNFTDHNGGTYTHTWERLLCWLATSRQYTIKGI